MVTKREPKKPKLTNKTGKKTKKKGLVYFTFKNKPSCSYNQINLMPTYMAQLYPKGTKSHFVIA